MFKDSETVYFVRRCTTVPVAPPGGEKNTNSRFLRFFVRSKMCFNICVCLCVYSYDYLYVFYNSMLDIGERTIELMFPV